MAKTPKVDPVDPVIDPPNDGDDGDAQPEGPALVLMERDGVHADVHPLEVENYAAGGWQPV